MKDLLISTELSLSVRVKMFSGNCLIYGNNHMVQNESHGGMLSDAQQRSQKYWVSFSTLSLIYCLTLGSSFF